MANLGVPLLMQGTPDTASRMTIARPPGQFLRQDVRLQNLAQYGIPYSLTTLQPKPWFGDLRTDLDWFLAVCRVVKGLKKLRNWRYRRAPGGLQHRALYAKNSRGPTGISVETLDLSESYGEIGRLKDDDGKVVERLRGIRHMSRQTAFGPRARQNGQARTVIDTWMRAPR